MVAGTIYYRFSIIIISKNISAYKVNADITSHPHVHIICKQVEEERSLFSPVLLTLVECGQWQRWVAL